MSVKYPYLKDADFLMSSASQQNIEQFVKITILNFNEKPIQSIEGMVTTGTINLDGNSSMRRTANLTVFIDSDNADYMKVDGGLFALNKKVQIEIGINNTTDKYSNFPILWFPQGIFVIMGINITHSNTGLSISLQLKDKMVFLNGECGGTISAATVFHEYEVLNPSTGEYEISKPAIIQIIRELVNHFGNEQLGKIIINDIDPRIKRVMKWLQPYALYYTPGASGSQPNYSLSQPQTDDCIVFETGDDVGYTYSDFYYPSELIADAGNTVCDILDKIKNTLGNFEYFYDINGNFIFQEIKNYLNTTKASIDIKNMEQQDYIIDKGKGNAAYLFNNSNIITSYSNAPQYNMIKNDFVVWGARKVAGDNKVPIRYHLAIDTKPQTGNTYTVCKHSIWNSATESYNDKYQLAIEYTTTFPYPGEVERYYAHTSSDKIYYWDPSKESNLTESFIPKGEDGKTYYHSSADNSTIKKVNITTDDWRSELFLNGTMSTRFGEDSNYYYTELVNEWPKLYDLDKKQFKPEIEDNLGSIDYFLDFIDSNAAISEFSISNIGRRTKVINDESINCIFEKQIPDVVLIKNKQGEKEMDDLRNECTYKGQPFAQVDENIYEGLAQGGNQNSAYNAIRDLLYQYTQYNETISVQTLPMFFLEPNIRISLEDIKSGIYGDYIINRISIPLDINGTTTLSCSRALTRI